MGVDYKLKQGERADYASLNKRFDDISLRLRKLEARGDVVDQASDELVKTGLTRINEVLAPAFESIQDKAHLGALLSTTAEQEVTLPFSGLQSFLVDEVDRNTFSPAGHLSFTSQSSPNAIMLGTLVAYDPETGALSVNITNSTTDPGTHTDWNVAITQPPEVGYSYSQAEVDQKLADLINGAPADLDTIGESAARISALENTKNDFTSAPSIILPQNDDTWQDVIKFLRGAGPDGISMQTLGDESNGIDGVRFLDDASGDTLCEIGADGNVSALGKVSAASFMADGMDLERIIKIERLGFSNNYTRTSSSLGRMSDDALFWPRHEKTRLVGFPEGYQYCSGTSSADDVRCWVELDYYDDVLWQRVGNGNFVGATNFGNATSRSVYGTFAKHFFVGMASLRTTYAGGDEPSDAYGTQPWQFRFSGYRSYSGNTAGLSAQAITAFHIIDETQ